MMGLYSIDMPNAVTKFGRGTKKKISFWTTRKAGCVWKDLRALCLIPERHRLVADESCLLTMNTVRDR